MSENVYFEIIFSGDYESVLKFMNEKDMKYLEKRVAINKIYFETPSETFEELSFFKGSPLDENFNKIEDLKKITQEEYNNAEIYKEEPKITKVTPDVTPLINVDYKNEDEPKEEEEEVNYTPINDKLSEILNNTILPSKSPLQKEDPMNYLTSKEFLIQFFTISSILLTFLSLFN